jgi:hypothetical protein
MTSLAIYAISAFLILIVAALLVRQDHGSPRESDCAQCLWDESFLGLAERIFDPSDCLWLRNELGFPDLAGVLARSRKLMALRWLSLLRSSVEELMRVPEPMGDSARANTLSPNWQLLWLTLRFQLFLGYATLVVRILGPYHRLVPPLEWMPSRRGIDARYRTAKTVDAV